MCGLLGSIEARERIRAKVQGFDLDVGSPLKGEFDARNGYLEFTENLDHAET